MDRGLVACFICEVPLAIRLTSYWVSVSVHNYILKVIMQHSQEPIVECLNGFQCAVCLTGLSNKAAFIWTVLSN